MSLFTDSKNFINNKFAIIFLFTLPMLIMISNPASIIDLSIWAKLGIENINSNSIITQDTLSFLNTTKMIYPSWGSTFLYGYIFALAGINGLIIFHYIILFLILYFVLESLIKKKLNTVEILFYSYCLYGASIGFSTRPALIGILFLAVTNKILFINYESFYKKFISVFLLTAFWINFHGSALILLPLTLWTLVISLYENKKDESVRNVKIFLAVLLAVLCNPWGYNIFQYAISTNKISQFRNMSEWENTFAFNYHFSQSILFLVFLSFLLIYLYKNKRPETLVKDPYFVLIIFGLLSVRHTALAFILFIPFSIRNKLISDFNPFKRELFKNSFLNSIILLTSAFYMFISLPTWKDSFKNLLPESKQKIISGYYPIKEINYLKENNLQGNIFNEMEMGGQLALFLPNKIMLDARNTIFSQKDLNTYSQIIRGQIDSEIFFIENKIRIIIVDKKHQIFINRIKKKKNWNEVKLDTQNFFAIK